MFQRLPQRSWTNEQAGIRGERGYGGGIFLGAISHIKLRQVASNGGILSRIQLVPPVSLLVGFPERTPRYEAPLGHRAAQHGEDQQRRVNHLRADSVARVEGRHGCYHRQVREAHDPLKGVGRFGGLGVWGEEADIGGEKRPAYLGVLFGEMALVDD